MVANRCVALTHDEGKIYGLRLPGARGKQLGAVPGLNRGARSGKAAPIAAGARTLRRVIGGFFLLACVPFNGPVHAANEDFFGWYTISFDGSLDLLSPSLERFSWLVMNQTRLGDDSSKMRENLIFAQLGYSVTDRISLWLGYTHNWIDNADSPSFEENRIYQDFAWRTPTSIGSFLARSRLEQRIRDPSGAVGVRFRQMFELGAPITPVPGLKLIASNEVFVYADTSTWGKSGFSENRAIVSLGYGITKHVSLSVGYMNQFVSKHAAPDVLNHVLMVTLAFSPRKP